MSALGWATVLTFVLLCAGFWRAVHMPRLARSATSAAMDYTAAVLGSGAAFVPTSLQYETSEFSLELTHVLHHGTQRERPGLFRVLDAKRAGLRPLHRQARDDDGDEGVEMDAVPGSMHAEAPLYRIRSRRPRALFAGLTGSAAGAAAMPDVTDRETVLTLAKMSFNAYTRPSESDWVDVGDKWNTTFDWGWATDGLRGYVFSSRERDLIVVVFKGTSANFLGIGGPSSPNDKFNDNRMFSCCCAKVSPVWRSPVCDCAMTRSTCNSTCLSDVAHNEENYHTLARRIYDHVLLLYPQSDVWLTGHSLGGGVASTLAMYTQENAALTRPAPAVCFNSPGERLFANRLGLGLGAADAGAAAVPDIWHFGVSADVIFSGLCTLPTNVCWIAGYALETKCHLGHECVYNVGGTASVQYHLLAKLIRDFIGNDLLPLPQCRPTNSSCVDCDWWQFL